MHCAVSVRSGGVGFKRLFLGWGLRSHKLSQAVAPLLYRCRTVNLVADILMYS